MSTDINVTIGTSEAVEALVHRYIVAREAELQRLQDSMHKAQQTARSFCDDLSERIIEQPGKRIAPIIMALYELDGDAVIQWDYRSKSWAGLSLELRHKAHSMDIPITVDDLGPSVTPERLAERDRLIDAVVAAEVAQYALSEKIRREGSRERLRGEMLARLVEAQAPELALTLNAIVGGTRQITSTEGRE